jgi:membrane fusion protein (multidrug efflux system)
VVDGLKPGDRVVVDGFQKFTAGDSVNPRSVVESARADTGAVPVVVGSR